MRFLAGLPIRVRLTVAFAAAMALVLAASGLFLYLRVNAALDRTIDQGLAGRADDVAALVRATDPGLGQAQGRRLLERDESFAQVLAPNGAVLDSTPGLHERQLLTGQELARATRATVIVDRPPFPDADDPLRLLATPVEAPGGRTVVVVVGASTEERAETLESLLGQLLLGGPLTLLAISLLGYLLAAAALRPVESMRREAEAVSASEPGRRLPLPPGDDEISRLGTTLNTMLDRLETALAQERRFVSDASHELRTPLASLRTELELALRRPRPAGELRSALASAAEETERLSRVADDLLVLARSDGGRLPVNPEPIPAAQLLAEVTERFRGSRRPRPAGPSTSRPRTALRWSSTASGPPRPSATWSTTPCATAAAASAWSPGGPTARPSSTCRTRARASRRGSSTTPSTASAGPTRPARAGGRPRPGHRRGHRQRPRRQRPCRQPRRRCRRVAGAPRRYRNVAISAGCDASYHRPRGRRPTRGAASTPHARPAATPALTAPVSGRPRSRLAAGTCS